jgi:hypothetical protein
VAPPVWRERSGARRDAGRGAERPRAKLATITDLLVVVGFIGAALLVVHLVRTLKPWERWALLEGAVVFLACAAAVVGVSLLLAVLLVLPLLRE